MAKSIKLLLLIATTLNLSGCTHIVNVNEDFNKIKADEELSKYVRVILNRINTFKVAVHPRIRLFYQLLKRGVGEYSLRTADSIYVPNKYNDVTGDTTPHERQE